MKKSLMLLMLLILLVPSMVSAQAWYAANQVTMAWDPVTTTVDGTTIPATDVIKYQGYYKMNAVEVGTGTGPEVTATQKLFTFTVEGSYFLGVKAIRYVNDAKVGESAIAWSNDPAAVQGGNTFGVVFYSSPAMPVGLRFPG